MPTPLFELPSSVTGPAADALALFVAGNYADAVATSQRELAALEQELPSRYNKIPGAAEANSAPYRYYALTLVLVNALAELQEWKAAKQALGKYRVHFPRDPWGFRAGAEVTRRDPEVKDAAAVGRAVELLEGEAERLEAKAPRAEP
jgi:hypothetical protein